MNSNLRVLLPQAYTAAIFFLSSIPDTDTPANALESALRWASPELQNLLHVPLFGGLAWCWDWGLRGWIHNDTRRVAVALALTLAWSILDELHQTTVPGRFGSLTDVLLNALGAVLALTWTVRHDRLTRSVD